MAEHAFGFPRLPCADMALPEREPIEALEHAALGAAFESSPVGLDRRQIVVDRKIKLRPPRSIRRPVARRVAGAAVIQDRWRRVGHPVAFD